MTTSCLGAGRTEKRLELCQTRIIDDLIGRDDIKRPDHRR